MSVVLNTKHLSGFINEEEYKAIYPQVEAAHNQLEAKNGPGNDFLGWMYLPRDYDKEEFVRIKEAAKKIREDSEVLVVAGIGGSYLGARAVIEAVKGLYHNELEDGPKIYFCGNSISPSYLNDIIALCKGKKFSINVISKSGTTTETSLAFRVLRKLLEDEMGVEEANKRIYATTDRAKGTLKQLADAQGWPTFVVPDDVGGRYSVLSAVGLLPIAAAGISIDDLMKGAADFLLAWLIPNPHNPNELITAPCTSPEADYITDKGYRGSSFYGGTADLAIIRELFKNTIKGAKALGIDSDYQQQLQAAVDRLRPYHIGKRGNLMEWYHDWDDQDWHHRHQSHLLGLYPFHQISVAKTPELAAAATKTLEIKGDNSTGWSTGWRINLWARLHRADKAYQIYRKLLTYVSPEVYKDRKHHSGGTYPNLFDAHPPFQIDGNFGGTAGVCEMLMQCDGETMDLLPALPLEWQAGEIKGLKARGNYGVSLAWNKGKLTQATITSKNEGNLTIHYNGKQKVLTFKAGETKTIR